VEKVLQDSGIGKAQVDEVVLVGGSTRIPKVQAMLSAFFNGKELCRSINPDEAVAYGAAVQAAVIGGTGNNSKAADVLMIDVTPLSLGIETSGELMTKVVERQTTIPCRKTQVFSTYQDNQPAVTIQVYEGERSRSKDNHMLGTFNLSDIPLAPRGVPQIEVSFEIDANGILTVSALDKGSGKKQQVTIKNDSDRLSEADVQRMVDEGEKYAMQDKAHAERIQAKNGLEGYVYGIRTQLGDTLKGALSPEDTSVAEKALDDTIAWLDDNADASKDSFEGRQRELEAALTPLLQKAQASSAGQQPFQDQQGTDGGQNEVHV
jgi:L1 cell adhesion molecule like protein